MVPVRLKYHWRRFWLGQAGRSRRGHIATSLAAFGMPSYKHRVALAWVHPSGYIAPDAELSRADLRLGRNIFIGRRVIVYRDDTAGSIELGDGVELHSDCIIEAFQGGSVSIGARTTIQPRTNFAAARADIRIGSGVQIAQLCGFYSYDHGFAPDRPIYEQAMTTRGPIIIGDDVWLGFNVVVLSGVEIGSGAAIGAGSVVTRNVPSGAIAAGVPARVLKMR